MERVQQPDTSSLGYVTLHVEGGPCRQAPWRGLEGSRPPSPPSPADVINATSTLAGLAELQLGASSPESSNTLLELLLYSL